jgi:hypothetical protein
VSEIRDRINQLLTDSGTYQQGRHDERHRLRQLITVRIDELRTVPRTELLCAELLHVRRLLDT